MSRFRIEEESTNLQGIEWIHSRFPKDTSSYCGNLITPNDLNLDCIIRVFRYSQASSVSVEIPIHGNPESDKVRYCMAEKNMQQLTSTYLMTEFFRQINLPWGYDHSTGLCFSTLAGQNHISLTINVKSSFPESRYINDNTSPKIPPYNKIAIFSENLQRASGLKLSPAQLPTLSP